MTPKVSSFASHSAWSALRGSIGRNALKPLASVTSKHSCPCVCVSELVGTQFDGCDTQSCGTALQILVTRFKTSEYATGGNQNKDVLPCRSSMEAGRAAASQGDQRSGYRSSGQPRHASPVSKSASGSRSRKRTPPQRASHRRQSTGSPPPRQRSRYEHSVALGSCKDSLNDSAQDVKHLLYWPLWLQLHPSQALLKHRAGHPSADVTESACTAE